MEICLKVPVFMNPFEKHWFVLRDLKRRNSNSLAVFELQNAGLEVFTPMTQMIMRVGGRRQRRDVPVIQDLLFVHESKENLDPYVSRCRTLQYRYLLGKTKEEPMTVRDDEMEKFIHAIDKSTSSLYYGPGELSDTMYGKKVRIMGGILDGYEGHLLSVKGMRKRRIIVELPGIITAAVEVEPDFIQIVK